MNLIQGETSLGKKNTPKKFECKPRESKNKAHANEFIAEKVGKRCSKEAMEVEVDDVPKTNKASGRSVPYEIDQVVNDEAAGVGQTALRVEMKMLLGIATNQGIT